MKRFRRETAPSAARSRAFLAVVAPLAAFAIAATAAPASAEPDPATRDAGFTLLQNFQCDNKGDVTQRVVDSIGRTKSVVAQIGETEQECRALGQEIARLPTVESIAQGIRTNMVLEAIREQESVINETLADLAFVSRMAPDDPQRALYPDTATLETTVQYARAELSKLKARLAVDEARRSKDNLISGIEQLDAIANGYAAALRGGEECFRKRPDIKQSLLSGVVGIAGFFLKGPLGVGTSLAGRLFQDIFNIHAANKNRIKDSFSAVDQTAIALGLGCAFEQLGKQHCRILREKELFASLQAPGIVCDATAEARAVLATQRDLLESLKKIEDWTSKTAVVAQDPSTGAMREAAKAKYRQTFSQMKQDVLRAETNAKAGATFNGQALSDGLDDVLHSYARLVNPRLMGMGMGMGVGPSGEEGSVLIHGSFTAEQQRNDMLALILRSDENPQDVYSRLREEYLAYEKDNSQPGSQAYLNSPNLYSADQMLKRLLGQPSERQGETTRMLAARLRDKTTPRLILTRMNDLEKGLESSLASDLSPEQTLAYINEYFQGEDVLDAAASPAEALRRLDAELQKMKRTAGALGERSGLNRLADSVRALAEEAKKQEKAAPDTAAQKKFIADLNALVGRNRELHTQLKTVLGATLAEKGRAVVQSSRDAKNEGAALQALFLLNQETLANTLGFAKNPSAKLSEYHGAAALSAAQIEGFSRFSEPYLDYAVKFLNGRDAKGNPLPAGIAQNVDPEIRNRFCVQALSLTELPSPVRELCKGARIQSGTLALKFEEFAALPHPARACAYYNFSTREQAAQQRRLAAD